MPSNFGFPNGQISDGNGNPDLSWIKFLQRLHRIGQAAQESGTTAQRPTTGLWVGRMYFDTDLGVDNIGKPVWLAQVGPPAVWVDATGNAV